MATQIHMPRAVDASVDPLPGALAYIYQTGTTTPIAVYANQELTIQHPHPIAADSAGTFPAVFFSGSVGARRVYTTATGGSVPGSPQDPAFVSNTSGSTAEGTSFSPITGNAEVTVQKAIETNTNRHENRSADVKGLLTSADKSELRTNMDLGDHVTHDYATNAEALAGTSAAKVMNPLETKNAFGGFVGAGTFTSAVTPIANSGQYVFAHGLTDVPDFAHYELICTTADLGYSVGDVIIVSPTADPTGTSEGFAAIIDATNITIRTGDNGPGEYIQKVLFSGGSLTATSWSLRVRAFKFA